MVDALAVRGGRISALGPEALAARGRGTTVVDLPGGALLPAFGDGHVHPVVGGLGLLGAPVRECTSVDGIVEALRHWADGHPEAEWITGDGFGSWLAPGTRVSFGSDWPVTDLEPLRGIATAVTRQTPEGIPDGGWLPQERIAISTALAAHCAGCAYQAFEEKEWGVLRPGLQARSWVMCRTNSAPTPCSPPWPVFRSTHCSSRTPPHPIAN
ncbi:amidohydrolase family protein [Streptomyces europaeiscabiei]|uniref:amidohydrolase family protein n=1 Tax=Streptomyces europaeiscabiei TaxID=146819 RepID=UPI002E11A539|nr:amidohydrolase family protein [Streptomyces europaeiscabiei]